MRDRKSYDAIHFTSIQNLDSRILLLLIFNFDLGYCITDAAVLMLKNKIHRIPIVNSSEQVVGMLPLQFAIHSTVIFRPSHRSLLSPFLQVFREQETWNLSKILSWTRPSMCGASFTCLHLCVPDNSSFPLSKTLSAFYRNCDKNRHLYRFGWSTDDSLRGAGVCRLSQSVWQVSGSCHCKNRVTWSGCGFGGQCRSLVLLAWVGAELLMWTLRMDLCVHVGPLLVQSS